MSTRPKRRFETSRLARPRVAYFSMEFGLDSRLPAYSGGLGILAGDFLKAARDHRAPVVGVGIRWTQGYGEQEIDSEGRAYEAFKHYTPEGLEDTGVTVSVTIRRRPVRCRVWRCRAYGNADLYLLDATAPGSADPTVTDQLYGGNGEQRVAQEMVLGIGGLRALRALGVDVDVYHFNEGHPVFAGLELIREKGCTGCSFEQAWAETKSQIVFTTHTPVEAGNETHPIDRLLYMGVDQGLTIEQLVSIGGAPFNMTAAALRLSRQANAVAVLHAATARRLWAHLPEGRRIFAITNAVHKPTWVDARVEAAVNRPAALWREHQRNKRALLACLQERTGRPWNPETLLLGFSRRAAGYKRGDLIFRNPAALEPWLKNGRLQIVWAGKSHPQDAGGRAIVEHVVAWARRYPGSMAFLENYDMTLGRLLTRGVDVWLNNPRRPSEASGTSGMKAAMNGVLNLSTLDGWWPEACRHGVNGWQFGDGREGPTDERQDARDLSGLFRVLRQEVLPTYIQDRARWIGMMQASIRSTRTAFSMDRMLDDYYRMLYAPGDVASHRRPARSVRAGTRYSGNSASTR